LRHLTNCTRTEIYYGGSASGKSVFLAQRAIYDVLGGKRNYLVCRAVGRTIRKSVFNEINKVITDWGLRELFTVNRTDGVVTCENGCQILFTGLDDTEKVKSITPEKGVITDIWIEEATETDRNSIKELYKRQRGGSSETPKRLTMSFNPIIQSHWIYDEYFSGIGWTDDQTEHTSDGLTILKTTYKDNRFLTDDDIRDLENEKDEYYRSVYTLGNWGVLGDVIFRNWEVQDLAEMRAQFTNPRNGLDFGFSSDPAALVVSHYDRARKTIYIYNELYERGLTNDMLANEIKELVGSQPVTCDSAEPKSIEELRRYGINSHAAKKGKDSVNHGIQWLQQQHIIIDKDCVNAKNEFMQYQWKKDKDGNSMKVPVDKRNHLIDGIRYAYEDDATEAWYFT
jgi:phage terminase large subunit